MKMEQQVQGPGSRIKEQIIVINRQGELS